MISRVRILNVTHVLPDQAQVPGHSPPPALPDDGLVKLSFMDAMFIDRASMKRLFFYEGPAVPPFPSLVRALQSSLAAVLALFVPLAGKITYRPPTGDVVVDCSGDAVSPGVKFVEAEFAGSIDDMRRLAVGDEHDAEALTRLGPELDAGRLPAPVLAVQVTRPAVVVDDGHAVVVAVVVHHAVADGLSVWRFMRTWSAVCRAGRLGVDSPTFDRAAIPYPRAEEAARKILHTIAPALPVAIPPSLRIPPDQRRRTFVLGADEIQRVKRRILAQSEAMGGEPLATHPISTFVAVSSLVWSSIARSKSTDDDDDPAAAAYYLVPADLRRRLAPPVDDRYFGNCVAPCFARACVGDLRDATVGLARAAGAIRGAIQAQQQESEPLDGVDGWLETFAEVPKERFTRTGSSNRFMAYETDFGWGKPSRVELVALFVSELVLLLGAREEGAVQVTVTLDHAHMDRFADNLLELDMAGSVGSL